MSETYAVEAREATVPVAAYLRSYVDVKKFMGFCQACPHYGRLWSCPPYDFAPQVLWRQFGTLRLFVRVLFPGQETTAVELLEGMEREKDRLLRETLALERAHPGALALSAGSCKACGQGCTRLEGAPCRHPEVMRWSIESLGGDVGKTTEEVFHRPLRWLRDDRLPEYLTLVGGLLLREETP